VTKAAINALTRTLAIDFSPHIRANAICPGFVRIANSENDRSPEELEAWLGRIASTYPLKRVCSVDEIADVALFLASDESSYINGQCLVVDGGRTVADSHEF
jgi:NAD(P)-dependent dehydrogenase (short-subunit alcohol dehydrogenase family)